MNSAQRTIALVLGVVPADYDLYDLVNLTVIPACVAQGHTMMQTFADQQQTDRIYYRARCAKCRARLSVTRERDIEGSAYEDNCARP